MVTEDGKIPGLPARISKWFKDSETIALAWLAGLPAAIATLGTHIAALMGIPEFKAAVDQWIAAHPTWVQAYAIGLPILIYYARTRRSSKDPV